MCIFAVCYKYKMTFKIFCSTKLQKSKGTFQKFMHNNCRIEVRFENYISFLQSTCWSNNVLSATGKEL